MTDISASDRLSDIQWSLSFSVCFPFDDDAVVGGGCGSGGCAGLLEVWIWDDGGGGGIRVLILLLR